MAERPGAVGSTVVITGASQGIGRAVALRLASAGSRVWAVARRREPLVELSRSGTSGQILPSVCDLTDAAQVHGLGRLIEAAGHPLTAVVHCCGCTMKGKVESTPVETLIRLFDINAASAYRLTQVLLDQVVPGGTIVFINSSQGLRAGEGASHYAASKHALKAIADALRQEVNHRGIRVTSIYPGRTATPAQEALYLAAGEPYRPEALLQPESVAQVIMGIIELPPTAEVTDLNIRPSLKSY